MNYPKTKWIFWTTILISFVLLIHNGLEPLFIFAYCLIPILIFFFYLPRTKGSLFPLALYLLAFGFLGRYTRYFRQNYASDVLLATHDYLGLLLAGQNPYRHQIFMSKGLIPFCYLPFELLWYLPAQVLMVDLRFFEMLISALVPLAVFLYGYLKKKWQVLPIVAVIALTPFLLDLSADGSNDNSAIFILLSSILFLVYARKKTSRKASFLSAIILGLALSFKHYVFFYFIFLVSFFSRKKNFLPLSSKKYLLIVLMTAGLLLAPFALTAPAGFFQSQLNIENRRGFNLWGWNLWYALKSFFVLSDGTMRLIRNVTTLLVIAGGLWLVKFDKLTKVFAGTVFSLAVYFILSKWTTYAYFTFLIPLVGLSAVESKD